jgi:hypothetical protein
VLADAGAGLRHGESVFEARPKGGVLVRASGRVRVFAVVWAARTARVAPAGLRRSDDRQEVGAGACGCGGSCARDNWVSSSAAAQLQRARTRH